jgi:cysteine synthase B
MRASAAVFIIAAGSYIALFLGLIRSILVMRYVGVTGRGIMQIVFMLNRYTSNAHLGVMHGISKLLPLRLGAHNAEEADEIEACGMSWVIVLTAFVALGMCVVGILEPTEQRATGIAIAMIGAAKGYHVELCMPACVSNERRLILQGLGSQVFLTPAKENIDGAIRQALTLLHDEPKKYYMPNQYENPDNVRAHFETTGPEIYRQTDGEIDYFVAGMGTTGTLMGTGRYLKSVKPEVKIVGVEPVMGHTIQGLKNMRESMVPPIYNRDELDLKEMVEDGEAFEMTGLLAQKEGIFVGTSSGAAAAVALRLAKMIDHGTIVILFPDRGDRYLSTMQFRSICAKCPP